MRPFARLAACTVNATVFATYVLTRRVVWCDCWRVWCFLCCLRVVVPTTLLALARLAPVGGWRVVYVRYMCGRYWLTMENLDFSYELVVWGGNILVAVTALAMRRLYHLDPYFESSNDHDGPAAVGSAYGCIRCALRILRWIDAKTVPLTYATMVLLTWTVVIQSSRSSTCVRLFDRSFSYARAVICSVKHRAGRAAGGCSAFVARATNC